MADLKCRSTLPTMCWDGCCQQVSWKVTSGWEDSEPLRSKVKYLAFHYGFWKVCPKPSHGLSREFWGDSKEGKWPLSVLFENRDAILRALHCPYWCGISLAHPLLMITGWACLVIILNVELNRWPDKMEICFWSPLPVPESLLWLPCPAMEVAVLEEVV